MQKGTNTAKKSIVFVCVCVCVCVCVPLQTDQIKWLPTGH